MRAAFTITVAYGDGVGPEIMDAALAVLQKAGAELEIEAIQLGGRVYSMGSLTGVLPSAWEPLARTGVLLKAPTFIPESEGVHAATTVLCSRFGIDPQARLTEQCPDYPDIAAAAYIGSHFAFFEPLQQVEADLAGKNKAHPAAMILAAVLMLRHLGQEETAARMHAALLETLRLGQKRIRTSGFAQNVMERLQTAAAQRLPVAS